MSFNVDILIVGGGVAGCLTAIQIHKIQPRLKIIIIEREMGKIVRGVAYSKHFIHQPLNVRVKGMSADPDNPVHFENWLTENQTRYPYFEFDRNSFVARSIYGDYLEEYFGGIKNKSEGKINVREGAVDSILYSDDGFRVITSTGEFHPRIVVLSSGNFLPKDLSVDTHHLSSENYFRNPWKAGLPDEIKPTKDVFIVGSGLTAVDIILGLRAKNHTGKIHLLSRNGYLPLPHKDPAKHFFSDPSVLLSGDIYKLFSAIRKEVKSINDPFKDWQDVMDSMRAFTSVSWQKLPDEHKKIFLSRLKPFWEIHRHRIPERSLILLEDLKKKNKLFHHRGKLQEVRQRNENLSIHFIANKETKIVESSYLINCTGPDVDFKNQGSEFYQNLSTNLEIGTDQFRLGLNCTPKGILKRIDGSVFKNFYCIGSLRKGILWETTAVSDIRMQAKEIAEEINCNFNL